MGLEQQNAIMRELELPIAMLYSGKKSIHAIVRVDAITMLNIESVLITYMMYAKEWINE